MKQALAALSAWGATGVTNPTLMAFLMAFAVACLDLTSTTGSREIEMSEAERIANRLLGLATAKKRDTGHYPEVLQVTDDELKQLRMDAPRYLDSHENFMGIPLKVVRPGPQSRTDEYLRVHRELLDALQEWRRVRLDYTALDETERRVMNAMDRIVPQRD